MQLFEKVGRNIRLTEEGRYYQHQVDAALHDLHAASMTLRDSRTNAPIVIRLGIVSGTLNGLVAQQIADCVKADPRVRFRLTESSASVLMDLVRQESLDMAIVDRSDRDRSLHFRKLSQRNFYVALPVTHPLADRDTLSPQEVMYLPQVVFNYDVGNSFGQWASGSPTDESVICTVGTAQAALDLVASGIGIAFIPETCLQNRPEIRYVPLTNWHQALYMCILYDKWLKPTIWNFCEQVVKAVRSSG